MRANKASKKAMKYALQHYAGNPPVMPDFAFNLYTDDHQWIGVAAFIQTEAKRFDKFSGQVWEMILATAWKDAEQVRTAVQAFKKQVPYADALISRMQIAGFDYIGMWGSGRQGAYIVHGDRLHPKMVKAMGWRDSVLWLRENIDEKAEQYDRDASDLYFLPLVKSMEQREKLLRA